MTVHFFEDVELYASEDFVSLGWNVGQELMLDEVELTYVQEHKELNVISLSNLLQKSPGIWGK